jgi:hypothetical protein
MPRADEATAFQWTLWGKRSDSADDQRLARSIRDFTLELGRASRMLGNEMSRAVRTERDLER